MARMTMMVVMAMIMAAGAMIMIVTMIMAAMLMIVVILLQKMWVNIQLGIQIEAFEIQNSV